MLLVIEVLIVIFQKFVRLMKESDQKPIIIIKSGECYGDIIYKGLW